jgi:NTP pyrophosphatase (non-canonical NTP hydrolase)
MQYSFPETLFVEENTPGQQLEHAFDEAEEIARAITEEEPKERIEEEIADLTHSLETFWRIIAKHNGPEYVQEVFNRVIQKNAARNYYTGA